MSDRVDNLISLLPRGNPLDEATWNRRHRLLLAVLAAHLPGLLIVAVVAGQPLQHAASVLAPVAAGLVVGLLARSRLVRSSATTLGLAISATVLVHLTGGLLEAHFHDFVVLGFMALYQDWRPYLVALGFVVVGHGLVGLVAPGSVFANPSGVVAPWAWALMHAGFLLAAAAANIVFWKQMERQQVAAQNYYAQLYEGERAVVAQLRQTEMVKDELIGVVGHEFRTPLTAIRGFARTLEARHERMDADAIRTCTQAIDREAKRLTRMVANLLTASEEIEPHPQDRAGLHDLVAAAERDVVETTPVAARTVRTHVDRDHVARMNAAVTHQLLFNLLDNAVKFAAVGSDVRVSTRRESDMIVLEVANVGPPIKESDRDRIFDAFVQADSSDTRRYGGMGLGLHISRKIVEAYGGRIAAYCEGPVVIFRVWLPAAPAEPHHSHGPPIEHGASTLRG
jgi:signal transduction histidine kinase